MDPTQTGRDGRMAKNINKGQMDMNGSVVYFDQRLGAVHSKCWSLLHLFTNFADWSGQVNLSQVKSKVKVPGFRLNPRSCFAYSNCKLQTLPHG